MKITDLSIKWLMFILFSIFFLAVVVVALIRNSDQKGAFVPGQFALVGGRPVIIKEGYVYEYGADGAWRKLEQIGEARQIVRGEELCVLKTDGTLYYGKKLDINAEILPLTSAYRLQMAIMALKYSHEEPFVYINQSIEYLNFRALLQNEDILYQAEDQYDYFKMEEDIPMFLSGSFILTEQGNVYYLKTESDGYRGVMSTDLECVYDGGDIIAISASETAARCLGLRKNGKVISWSDVGPLEVTGWKNVIAIEQGFNYAVGLTDRGSVLYADYNSNNTKAVTEILEQWTDVTRIASNYDIITGLKKDDSCYFLNLSEYR